MIARFRKSYPHAIIYCATSPMLWGEKDTTERKWLHQIVQDENASGDTAVHFLDFKTQDPKDGPGADWHPNIKPHDIMAQTLEEALQSDLHGKSVAVR